MAEDNDDNILIDSDDEQTPQKRRSRASDFIPKPRLNLPSQVTKLVTGGATSPHDNTKLVLQGDTLTDTIPERRHSHLTSSGAPATDNHLPTVTSSSLPKSVTLNVGDDSPRQKHHSNNSVSIYTWHVKPAPTVLIWYDTTTNFDN